MGGVALDDKIHNKFKTKCSKLDMKMKDVASLILEDFVENFNEDEVDDFGVFMKREGVFGNE